MELNYPNILIVSRLVWNDGSNSNTLSNIFANYNPENISRIYIETKQPNTKCCNKFFQISEISLIKKLFKWNTVTGKVIKTTSPPSSPVSTHNELVEEKTMGFVRKHRFALFGLLREILWMFNGWKSEALDNFIRDTHPDIIWLDGSPLILMNRLNNYVRRQLPNVPAITFLMDDVYTYKSCNSIYKKIYRFFLRRHVVRTIESCQKVFVASPKMKQEYDKIFNFNSTVITKSLDFEGVNFSYDEKQPHSPIKMVYLGNVLIGRLNSLEAIASEMKEINKNGIKIILDVYTGDYIPIELKNRFKDSGVTIKNLVPYDKTKDIINNADVQVFVEAISGSAKNIARLSFSTKIIDYLTSGKCILAVGATDLAPIEYLKNEDAAIVATNRKEIRNALEVLQNPSTIKKYAQKAFNCGKRNHNKADMDKIIYGTLVKICKS